MRVLHLAAGNLYGGVETLLVTLARCRDLCPEMVPEFALCFPGRLGSELVEAEVPVHQLGAVRFSRPWTVWQARRRLRRLLAAGNFDVVVCHECWPHVLSAPVARALGLPVVFWAHAGHAGTHWLERWARRTRPDLVLANSRWTQSHLENLFPGVWSEVRYLPLLDRTPRDKMAARRDVRAELGTSEESVVIIQSSRLERWKGHEILLESLRRLSGLAGWECWVVGGAQRPSESAYLEGLRAQAKALGLEGRVRFLGQRADVPSLLAAADIHCQPNTGPEPFGIAFVEAMYAGLPVVTSAIGGALEVVDRSCGLLIPPGEPELLATSLRGLVTERDRRNALGARGPARARTLCDLEESLSALAGTLSTLVGGEAVVP